MTEGTIAFESNATADSKRMFTYLPLVLVNVDGSPVEKQPKPIIILRAKVMCSNRKSIFTTLMCPYTLSTVVL